MDFVFFFCFGLNNDHFSSPFRRQHVCRGINSTLAVLLLLLRNVNKRRVEEINWKVFSFLSLATFQMLRIVTWTLCGLWNALKIAFTIEFEIISMFTAYEWCASALISSLKNRIYAHRRLHSKRYHTHIHRNRWTTGGRRAACCFVSQFAWIEMRIIKFHWNYKQNQSKEGEEKNQHRPNLTDWYTAPRTHAESNVGCNVMSKTSK